jgi:hypothetical protein
MRLIIATVCFCLIACSSSTELPSNILPQEKMKQVLFDMIRADEYINNYVVKDSTKNITKERSLIYEKVFTLHKTNHKEFYESYRYYQLHPDKQKELFDSLYNWASLRKDTVRKGVQPILKDLKKEN